MSCSDLFPPSGLLLLLVGLACLASAGVGAATAYMFGQSKVVRLEAQVAKLVLSRARSSRLAASAGPPVAKNNTAASSAASSAEGASSGVVPALPPSRKMAAESSAALAELRRVLPHGSVGRLVNSLIFAGHPDAKQWQRLYRQALYDARTVGCPFVLTYDPDYDEGSTIGFTFELARDGFGSTIRCAAGCDSVLCLSVCLERAALKMNLQIEHPSSWSGDIPLGFELKVDKCSCNDED